MIKKPQYPKHEIWFDEESKKYLMVFDGLDGVPIPFSLELSEIGAETIKTAFVNTPIHLATGNFLSAFSQRKALPSARRSARRSATPPARGRRSSCRRRPSRSS